MNDFVNWLEDEHPFYFYFTFVFLGIAAYFAMFSAIVLATNGVWLPLVVIISAPLVRLVFLYVRFKNDFR